MPGYTYAIENKNHLASIAIILENTGKNHKNAASFFKT
jgi:hypothetical protein